METSPKSLSWNSVYKILSGSIVPRPIGWVSTINSEGQPNLAPFSFFNVVCANPPTVLFCPMIRTLDGQQKDTLKNIEATGAFVINIVGGDLAGKMNATSVEAPANVNEFEFAGLTPEPSREVKPPRVAESPIHLECKLKQIIEISREPGGGSVVIGTVVHIHVEQHVLVGEDKINLSALNPVGRLAGNLYARMTDVFEMERPPSQIRGKSM